MSTYDDAVPFLDHMSKLFPNDHDRNIVMSYMATMVQNPDQKLSWALILQGAECNGKGLLGSILKHGLGADTTADIWNHELTNPFTGWVIDKKLIVAEGISFTLENVVRLKAYITSDRLEVERKGKDRETFDNTANWLIVMSGQPDAYPDEVANSRRFYTAHCAQQGKDDNQRDGIDGEYLAKLYQWLIADNGYAKAWKYLSEYDISEFDLSHAPEHPAPPVTLELEEAITDTMKRLESSVGGVTGSVTSVAILDSLDAIIDHCRTFAEGLEK